MTNAATATQSKFNVRTLVGMGILTAIVIVLQAVASTIKFGTFSITLVLAPIIIGAAMYGWKAGTWLGLVFGAMVLISGDAAAFLAVNAPGTVITVLAKGILAGLAAGFAYRCIEKHNRLAAVITAGVVCPVVNTGIFILGSYTFFLDTIRQWGEGSGYSNATAFIFFGMIGVNFLVELGINLVLSTAIVRILETVKKPSASV
jgi:uncharacterized membrane protein